MFPPLICKSLYWSALVLYTGYFWKENSSLVLNPVLPFSTQIVNCHLHQFTLILKIILKTWGSGYSRHSFVWKHELKMWFNGFDYNYNGWEAVLSKHNFFSFSSKISTLLNHNNLLGTLPPRPLAWHLHGRYHQLLHRRLHVLPHGLLWGQNVQWTYCACYNRSLICKINTNHHLLSWRSTISYLVVLHQERF